MGRAGADRERGELLLDEDEEEGQFSALPFTQPEALPVAHRAPWAPHTCHLGFRVVSCMMMTDRWAR